MRLICPTCEIEVNTLVSDVDGSTEHVCQFHGSVTPRENTAGEFRGYDDEGHKVVVGCKANEFPIVILDKDGVVDRVATAEEADEYVASMPSEKLRWEREA